MNPQYTDPTGEPRAYGLKKVVIVYVCVDDVGGAYVP